MRREGKSRLWKTAGFSIALGESLMTSRPTLTIQSLTSILPLQHSTSGLPVAHSLSPRLTPPPPKKKQHVHTHSDPSHPSQALDRRFSLRGWPKRHCCFHSLPRDSASNYVNSNEDFETTSFFFLFCFFYYLQFGVFLMTASSVALNAKGNYIYLLSI